MKPEVKPGKYQHFRNKKIYEVVGTAVHTETREEVVVYKSLYDAPDFPYGSMWVRPKTMFTEMVDAEGEKVPRFAFIKE